MMIIILLHIFMLNIQVKKAVFDFKGNIIKVDLASKTATKLVREWVDLHVDELEKDWKLAVESKVINKIQPLL